MAFPKPLALGLFLAMAATAQAETPLERMLAQSAKTAAVAFERTTRADVRAHPDREPALVVDRFTPKAGTAGVWTIVSVDGHKPGAAQAEALIQANGPPPGFHTLHTLLSRPPAHMSEKDGNTVYLWKGLPKGSVVTPGGDISAHLSAEVTFEGAGANQALSTVRVFAAKPFHVRVIASINRFNVVSLYRPGANGTSFLVEQVIETDVSAPMGMGGKRHAVASFKPL